MLESTVVNDTGSPGAVVRELLRSDTRTVPGPLLLDQNDYAAAEPVTLDREKYLSPEFQRRENELLWGRVWQIACHEDQIQRVGDYVLYEIADKSLIVVRTAPGEIRAYYNTCLHRGRTLCDADGHVNAFRCKFHGFMWKLDGSLHFVPSRWDFPRLDDSRYRLPQATVATWAGFVFVNMDPDAIPFEQFIGYVPEHFRDWHFGNRHLVGHVGQVVRANWKVCVEAFLELYHGMATHPQVMPCISDADTRYTVRKDHPHCSHMIMPNGVSSPYAPSRPDEQQMLDALLGLYGPGAIPGEHRVPPGSTARQCAAELSRARMAAATGRDFAQVSDTEMVDGWVYSLFPNITLWGAYATPFWYRFRPWQNDPGMALMEIFIMPEMPAGVRPPAPRMTLLGPDQRFSDAPEFPGTTGEFFNQDLGNLEWVQKGLGNARHRPIPLARYQESAVRLFHDTLDRYLSGERVR